MNKFLPLALLLVAEFIVCGAKNSQADEPQYQKTWEAIKAVKTTEDYPRAWLDIAFQCNDHFEEVTKIKDPETQRKFIAYFVNQFGRHGAQADIRWLLVNSRITLPDWSSRPAYSRPSRASNVWAQVPEEFSEAVVRRCLVDKHFLHRYYVAVLSTGMFIRVPDREFSHSVSFFYALKHANDGLKSGKEKNAHWQFLRRFVLLAHAVNKDDLFTSIRPNELEKQVPKFWEWYLENWRFLQPAAGFRWKLDTVAKGKGEGTPGDDFIIPPFEFPKKPFPDWKDTPPPPIRLYSSI